MKKRWIAWGLLFAVVVMLLPVRTFAAAPASGDCGENATWTLDQGVLTISGTGAIDDFDWWGNPQPWGNFCGEIQKIIVSDGITRIGVRAFVNCSTAEEICLPDSVTSLGENSFMNCRALKSLRLPAGITDFDPALVIDCSSLVSVTVSPENQTFQSVDGVLFSKGEKTLYYYPQARQALQYTVPSGTEVIEYGAFQCNPFVQCVGVQKSIRSVSGAFNGCFNLSDLYYEGSEADWENVDHQYMNLTVHFLWDAGSEMTAKAIPIESCNREEQNYGTWSRPVRSYLIDEPDGSVTRVEAFGDCVVAETYDRQKLLLSHKVISPFELTAFGGFYATDQYYFLVFGAANEQERDSAEVLRTVRYTKDWERIDSASIYGANTHFPFDAGSMRMAHYGDYLYVLTCHEMYKSSDGYNHQANLMYSVHIPDMKVTDSQYWVSNIGTGYVSHSFNQFIEMDGDKILTVNHGDAYPRAVTLCEYEKRAGQDRFTGGCRFADFLTIAGECGDNYTGVSVGGFEVTGSTYMTAGNSTEQTEGKKCRQRNIFISTLPKGTLERTDKAELRWVTDYAEGAGVTVSTPHLVKITDNRLLLLWTEWDDDTYYDTYDATLHYQMVDGSGKALSEIYTGEHTHLSDCKPIVSEGTVTWYVTEESAPVFYSISIDSPEELKVVSSQHDFKAVKTEPTCTEEGYTTYTCSVCGASYVDDFVPALGHDWGEPSYEWNEDHTACTATRVCRRDTDHVETAQAKITSSDVAASCTEKKKTVYTAEFEEEWAETQTAAVETGEPLGHDWGEPVYEWNDDHTACTATRVCRRDENHTETAQAEVSFTATVPPTCETAGKGKFTAVFAEDWAETQTAGEAEIAPLGHDWGKPIYEWNEDYTACTAKRVCKRDASHMETAKAIVTSEVTAPATCAEKGKTAYTAKFEEKWAETQTVILDNIDALGHDWGKTTYEWNEDYTTCTAKRVCRRDANHVETAKAEVTSEQTRAPAVNVPGEMTYTAEFTVDWAETQNKIAGIPALPEIDASEKFIDVPKNAWYVDEVSFAVSRGLFGGTGENTFEPESSMTRAMLVTVLWRYEEEPEAEESAFTDVDRSPESWYRDAVDWAAANGIVGGIGDNKFDPDGNVTREQMAAILYRYAGKKGFSTSRRGDVSNFPDENEISKSWALEPLQWAVGEKLIAGSDGKLLPQGNATRAQVATILMRFIQNIAE